MKCLFLVALIVLVVNHCESLQIKTRAQWHAENCSGVGDTCRIEILTLPAETVSVYLAHGSSCTGASICESRLKDIQKKDAKHTGDVKANFLVGENGVYEGLGWNKRSSETNDKSLRIAVIGGESAVTPTVKNNIRDLVDYGKKNNYIKSNARYIEQF